MLRGNGIEPDESRKMLVPNGGLNGFPLTRWRIALILPGISKQYRRACSQNIRPRTFRKFKVETKLLSKLRIFTEIHIFTKMLKQNDEYYIFRILRVLHILLHAVFCVLPAFYAFFTLSNFLLSKCIKIRCLAVLFKRLCWFECEIIWLNWWNYFFFFFLFIPNKKIRIKRNIHHITFILFQHVYPLATRTRHSYQ